VSRLIPEEVERRARGGGGRLKSADNVWLSKDDCDWGEFRGEFRGELRGELRGDLRGEISPLTDGGVCAKPRSILDEAGMPRALDTAWFASREESWPDRK